MSNTQSSNDITDLDNKKIKHKNSTVSDVTDMSNILDVLLKQLEEYKKHFKIFTTPSGFIEYFLNDPLLYISYLALAINYIFFSHIHLLTLAYCCNTYRSIKMGYLNGFGWISILTILYYLYYIFRNLQ